MTLFRLALRSHVGGFAATTALGLVFGLLNSLGYAQIAGGDLQARAAFAQQMEVLGAQLSYILPAPLQLDTLGGYMHWRAFGTLPVVYGFWAVVAASGAARGDEERGLVEQWLAAGVPRLRYLLARVAAFALAAAASIALTCASVSAGAVAGGEAFPHEGLVGQGTALLAVTVCSYALALVVAQLATTRRGAAGVAGVVLLALFLVNSSARTGGGLSGVRWLSPFWAYERSTPLLRGGSLDAAATALLVAAALVLAALAGVAFASRDLGASLVRRRAMAGRASSRPARDPFLRMPVLAPLDQQRGWIAGWMIGVAVLGAFLVSLTRAIMDVLATSPVPAMRVYFERSGINAYETFVAVIWGSTAMLLLSLYAIFGVNGWVADDAEGRLEAVLAQPVSRARVVLERVAALVVGAAIVIAFGSVAVWAMSGRESITLDAGRYTAGSALLVTVPLAFGAVGAAAAVWQPRVAVPILFVVAAFSYVAQQFAPLFDWPEWVQNASIYALYGMPIAKGVDVPGIATLIAIAAAGTALAVVLIQRRDVGR